MNVRRNTKIVPHEIERGTEAKMMGRTEEGRRIEKKMNLRKHLENEINKNPRSCKSQVVYIVFNNKLTKFVCGNFYDSFKSQGYVGTTSVSFTSFGFSRIYMVSKSIETH